MQNCLIGIEPDHLIFEQQLLRYPLDVKTWFRYIEYQAELRPKLFLYLRALSKCPFYYKLWFKYLQFKLEILPETPLYQDLNSIVIDFELCLIFMDSKPVIYKLYLEFLISKLPYRKLLIMETFDKMLKLLPYPLHKQFWDIILKFAENIDNHLAATLYKRYFLTLNTIEEKQKYLKLLLELDVREGAQIFFTFMKQHPGSLHFIEKIVCEYASELGDFVDVFAILSGIIKSHLNYKVVNALARFQILEGDIEGAISTFERSLNDVESIYDGIFIYEQYLLVLEQYVEILCEEESDLSGLWMEKYKFVLERHQIIIQSILTRQFPNSIEIWRNYINLQKMLKKPLKQAYQMALHQIDPKRATPPNQLQVFWKEYADSCGAEVYNEATQFKFQTMGELEEMYIIKAKHFHDEPLKAREIYEEGTKNCKGFKIWYSYLDYEEKLGSDKVIQTYEACIKSKQATPQIFMNYIVYLHHNEMYEAMFSIFERAVQAFRKLQFSFFESYLPILVQLHKGSKIERIRHTFENCLKLLQDQDCSKFLNWYALYEIEFGMIQKAIHIYEKGTKFSGIKDKLSIYNEYIKNTIEYCSVNEIRTAYTSAIESLPDDDARKICFEFIKFELNLGEIDRVRELYSYGSQLANPSVNYFHLASCRLLGKLSIVRSEIW
eukprot:NODE_321_length_9805_cov_0.700185.p1 type:complete len:664 gc:universal NODE_321_length_9805_cov_0.700185:5579-7570(+)